MTLSELIRDAALLGYALAGVLLALTLAVIVITLTSSRRDDDYRPIGDSAPSPPRSSPFAPPVARGETGLVGAARARGGGGLS